MNGKDGVCPLGVYMLVDCSGLIPGWEEQGRTQKGGVYYGHQGWARCRESRGGGGPQARGQCACGEQQSIGPA